MADETPPPTVKVVQIALPDLSGLGKLLALLKTPTLVAITALVTWFAQHYLNPTPAPAPAPTPPPVPAPVRPEDAGKAYIPALADAYAAKLHAYEDAIRSGGTIDDAEKAAEKVFLDARQAAFAARLQPILEKIAPNDSLVTPEGRVAYADAIHRIANGLSPERNHAPQPPPTPSPTPSPTPPRPQPDVTPGGDPPGFPTGLLDDPEGRQRLLSTFQTRSLREAAPHFFRAGPSGDGDKDVYLYRAWKEVLGQYPKYPAQQVGDCTSFGSAHAIDLLQCIDIVLQGLDKSSYEETCTEAIYGFGREVAGMLNSWGDGCYGVAVARGLTKYGVVSRKFLGLPYDGLRARQWGSGQGVPQKVRQEASKHLLGDATLVTTTTEADAALENGYPFILCSMQGFNMARDATGTCYARGRWAHCMFVAGKRKFGGTRKQYLVCQSWGPNVPSGPTSDDQPDFSFWVDAPTIAGMLRGEDSLAFSRFAGFRKRAVPQRWRHTGLAGDRQPAQIPTPVPLPNRQSRRVREDAILPFRRARSAA